MENRRERFRKGLSPLYLPIYDMLCAELSSDWQPYCGLRTFEEQDRLYAQGRTTKGKMVTKAKAGQSAHNYGCASDWTIFVGGVPQWPNLESALWDHYREIVWKAGATWGGTWFDGPHNELKVVPGWKWTECKRIWELGGQSAVEEFIRSKK